MRFPCQKRGRGPVLSRETSSVNTSKVEAVFWIHGHQDKEYGNDYGTETYNDIPENHSNKAMIEMVFKKYRKESGKIMQFHLKRIESSSRYSRYCSRIKREIKKICKLNSINVKNTLVIECHYNAADVPEARGGKAMVGDHRSAIFSYPIITRWCEKYGIKKRRSYQYISKETGEKVTLKGVHKKTSGRGSGWLNAMADIGCYHILWEPFFCDYRTEISKQFFDDHTKGLEMMSDFWVNELKRMEKNQ